MEQANTDSTALKNSSRSFKDYLLISARGFCMGAADVVPGVSGGTMAFILGIYDELIGAIHSINGTFIRHVLGLRLREALAQVPWQFLLALMAGIVAAIFLLARPLKHALETHPSLVFAFFFGLVLASVLVVRKRVTRWTPTRIGLLGAAAMGAFVLVGLAPTKTPNDPLFLFLSGAIAICAMILPGISGSFILVLLGKYEQVIGAVAQLDIVTLVIFAAGCVVGLLSFVRLLRWLLRHYHDATIAVLTGFMLGSLRRVWPWQDFTADGTLSLAWPAAINGEVILAAALVMIGVGLVLLLERLAEQRGATATA
jgi:putative membrane protein